jgi:hypothetical protein
MTMRRFLNILTIISLVLCITSIGAWALSTRFGWQIYRLTATPGGSLREFRYEDGLLSIWVVRSWPPNAIFRGTWRSPPATQPEFISVSPDPDIDWRYFGLSGEYGAARTPQQMTKADVLNYRRADERDDGPYPNWDGIHTHGQAGEYLGERLPYWRIHIPMAIFIAVFGVLPVGWLSINVIRAAFKRPLPGHCLNCGYDLRASKDRCPECGTAISREAVPQ